jgi:hypothetical protein
MRKTAKTTSELEELVMAKLRNDPQCDHVEAVVITRLGMSWGAIIQQKGSQVRPDCIRRLDAIVAKLSFQYDLSS